MTDEDTTEQTQEDEVVTSTETEEEVQTEALPDSPTETTDPNVGGDDATQTSAPTTPTEQTETD